MLTKSIVHPCLNNIVQNDEVTRLFMVVGTARDICIDDWENRHVHYTMTEQYCKNIVVMAKQNCWQHCSSWPALPCSCWQAQRCSTSCNHAVCFYICQGRATMICHQGQWLRQITGSKTVTNHDILRYSSSIIDLLFTK